MLQLYGLLSLGMFNNKTYLYQTQNNVWHITFLTKLAVLCVINWGKNSAMHGNTHISSSCYIMQLDVCMIWHMV